uniref:Uncharacterized protein n=1 Tax=Fusarium oxysporum (strain Fo5176) TaxID=660025 RepID=A0A0D2YKS9_FUSOF
MARYYQGSSTNGTFRTIDELGSFTFEMEPSFTMGNPVTPPSLSNTSRVFLTHTIILAWLGATAVISPIQHSPPRMPK